MEHDKKLSTLEDEMASLIAIIESEDDSERKERLIRALDILETEYSEESCL